MATLHNEGLPKATLSVWVQPKPTDGTFHATVALHSQSMKCGGCKSTLSKIVTKSFQHPGEFSVGTSTGVGWSEISWKEERSKRTNAL